MRTISTKSNAKINLGLNVVGKLENGYHNLEMIMVPIDLYDEIEIKFFNQLGDLKIKTNIKDIPTDKNNIIYKIYEEFYKLIGKNREKIEVNLTKNIPSQAGLGGGSGNGAFFLKELNKYYNNILKEEELLRIGLKVGADIPFFLINEPAIVKGIGEKIENLDNINKEFDIILIRPNFGISTKEAYNDVLKLKNIKYANIEKIVKGLKIGDLELIDENIENSLQQNIKIKSQNIMEFENKLKKVIDKKFHMSGSGSCYYILTEKNRGENIKLKLEKNFPDCFININKII